MRTRCQSYGPFTPAGQEDLTLRDDVYYPLDLVNTPASIADASDHGSELTPYASPLAATPKPSASHHQQEQQPDSSSILADDLETPKKTDDSITDFDDDGSVYDAFNDMSSDEEDVEDVQNSDDSCDEQMPKKRKLKRRVNAKKGKQAKQTLHEEVAATSPFDSSDDSTTSRRSNGNRDSVPGAPSANTDLPWAALSGITSEELLAFFPNHAIKWPAIAARLVEDGWMPKRIANFINNSRALTDPSEVMLANTIQISMTRACAVFYGKASYKLREEVKELSERTPEQAAGVKKALTERSWGPKKSNVHLHPAWSLDAIAAAYVGSELSFPCDGALTKLMLAATTDPSFIDPTQPTLAMNEPSLQYDDETGSAHIVHEPLSRAVQNPPLLPDGWIPYYSKPTKKRTLPSPDPEERQRMVKQPKTDSLKLNARKKWITREDLPANVRNNANAIIEGYPQLLAGELILWLISKTGGQKTVTQIHAQLVKKFGKKKAIDRSTLAYRKISALKERAKKNNTTYDTEYREFELVEFRHVREGAASKKRKAVSAQETAETVDEDVLEEEMTELTGAAATTTSYPLDDNANLTAAETVYQAPTQAEFTFEHDMNMQSMYMSSPELQDSINAWLDLNNNNANGTIEASPMFSGAGLGIDFSQVGTYVPAQAQSSSSQRQSSGSVNHATDNDGDSPMGNTTLGVNDELPSMSTFDDTLDHMTFCEQYQFDTSSPHNSNPCEDASNMDYSSIAYTSGTSMQEQTTLDNGGFGMDEKYLLGEDNLNATDPAGLDQGLWDSFIQYET